MEHARGDADEVAFIFVELAVAVALLMQRPMRCATSGASEQGTKEWG